MSKGENNSDIIKKVNSLEENVANIKVQISKIDAKIDHIINFLEFLIDNETEEQEDDDQDIYDSDETWVEDPDSWKNNEYDEDDDEDDF